jgi:uncharacterized protein YecA (UPF0149 family)
LIDKSGETFSRKDIVLSMANKDGGAHVDPELDAKYSKLTREASVAMNVGSFETGEVSRVVSGSELASVRQIGHEMLKTLKEDYRTPERARKPDGVKSLSFGGVRIEPVSNKKQATLQSKNSLCECGSGLKYKRCCGKSN